MARPLRICFLAPGSNVHTRRWVTAFADRGHQVLLVPQGHERALPVEVFDPYARMGRLVRVPKVRAWIAERMILERLRRFQPDVVHLHWLNPTFGTLRLVRRVRPLMASAWGRDVIWDVGGVEPWSRRYTRRRILARAQEITATSTFLRDKVAPFVPAGRSISVIPFGIDCARFRPARVDGAPEPPVIGYLKHYTPKYGPDVLLRAAQLLHRRGVRFRIEMFGTQDPAPYRALAEELGIEAVVSIQGAVEHDTVPERLNRFDVFAMPSIHDSETFGVAALEAAACGLPVVASSVGGVPEVVVDGRTGRLVPPGNPEALALALEELLKDAGLRERMGEAGRRLVLERYRWSDCVDQMERLYLGLKP